MNFCFQQLGVFACRCLSVYWTFESKKFPCSFCRKNMNIWEFWVHLFVAHDSLPACFQIFVRLIKWFYLLTRCLEAKISKNKMCHGLNWSLLGWKAIQLWPKAARCHWSQITVTIEIIIIFLIISLFFSFFFFFSFLRKKYRT